MNSVDFNTSEEEDFHTYEEEEFELWMCEEFFIQQVHLQSLEHAAQEQEIQQELPVNKKYNKLKQMQCMLEDPLYIDYVQTQIQENHDKRAQQLLDMEAEAKSHFMSMVANQK